MPHVADLPVGHIVERAADAKPPRRADLELEIVSTILEWYRTVAEYTSSELGEMLGVNERTVKRWTQKETLPAPEQRAAIRRLNELRFLLSTVMASETAALTWLHTPTNHFRGRSPTDVLRSGGVEDVIGLLAAFESGAHL